ncbi:hypothetical protein LP420_37935 [Massilia sp. B-10]|nr:hypothetical protein LP420_37935 [Massilia sp. B-10]
MALEPAAGAATTFSGVELITSSLRSKGYPHGTYDRPAIRIVEARAPGSAEGDTVRLLVERKEANDNGFSQICIFYWLLRDDDTHSEIPTGEFAGAYDSACADISLTASCLSTGGYVVIDPPSLRGLSISVPTSWMKLFTGQNNGPRPRSGQLPCWPGRRLPTTGTGGIGFTSNSEFVSSTAMHSKMLKHRGAHACQRIAAG